jgi:REP element-mobilizing transposase RayT
VRDLIRLIASEHEAEIISGKIARDHVHVYLSYRPTMKVSHIAVIEGSEFAGSVAGLRSLQRNVHQAGPTGDMDAATPQRIQTP